MPGAGKLEISWTPADGSSGGIKEVINDFKGAGVALGMFNTDDSIRLVLGQSGGDFLHCICPYVVFILYFSFPL